MAIKEGLPAVLFRKWLVSQLGRCYFGFSEEEDDDGGV